MASQTYDFPDHRKGDTFAGVQFTITKNGSPLDLTSASLRMEMRELTPTGSVGATFTDDSGGGLTITDAVNGVLTFDEQVVDVSALLYHYDIQITLSNGDVKSYIVGTWDIIQDVTQPAI